MLSKNLLAAAAISLASLFGPGTSSQAQAQSFVYASPFAKTHFQFGVLADD